MSHPPFCIEPLTDPDIVNENLRRRWGETVMMFGRSWQFGDFQVLGAYDRDHTLCGMVTYAIQRGMALALTIDNFSAHPGVGSLLLDAVREIGREQGARTLRVVTTNDNTPALRYFQKRGFKIIAFYPGAVAAYRAFVPGLRETGVDDIPIRDTIELEMDL